MVFVAVEVEVSKDIFSEYITAKRTYTSMENDSARNAAARSSTITGSNDMSVSTIQKVIRMVNRNRIVVP